MIDLTSLPDDRLNQMRKEIKRQVIERGWKASIPYLSSAGHYFITRSDGKKLHIFSSTPPTTSYAAASLANNKFATYELLKENNIPQLDTIRLAMGDNIDGAVQFMKDKGTVVVKPVDGGHGKGITIGITNETELQEAVKVGLAATRTANAVLVQQHYPHEPLHDLRVLCIDYKHVASIQRLPARVFGDGNSKVGELIELENAKERRGKAYQAPLATISIENASKYLKDKINYVPKHGEEVQVLGVVNYGAGGETLDVTDDVPDWLIKYAEDISKICGLPVVGVDFMMAASPKKHMTREELDIAMTEVNKAPLLTMHDTPTYGVSRHAMDRYMDYLESL